MISPHPVLAAVVVKISRRHIAFPGRAWDPRSSGTGMDSPLVRSSPGRVTLTAVAVLAGCYLGAGAGVWLRFPGVGAAILFPPYAIVTAALLRTPPRYWWILLLAASAGDFIPHRLGGASVGFA